MTDLRALVRARLDQSVLTAGRLYDTALDSEGGVRHGNYLLMFSPATPHRLVTERETRAPGPDDEGVWRWTLRAVAVDTDGVGLLLRTAFGLLVGHRFDMPGRMPGRIEYHGAEDIKVDRAVTPPLFFGETDYSVRI